MADVNIGQMLSSTISDWGDLEDDLTNNLTIYKAAKLRNAVKIKQGGANLIRPTIFAGGSNFTRTNGRFESVSLAEQRPLDSFVYDWKYAMTSLVVSEFEALKNRGKSQKIDYVKTLIKATKFDLMNNFEIDSFSNGTADGGKQIGGFGLLFPGGVGNQTGIIGGVDRSLYPVARNYAFSGLTNGGATVSVSNIKKYLSFIIQKTTRGGDRATDIFLDDIFYNMYLEANQGLQRFDDGKLDAGFSGVATMDGVRVWLAGGYGGAIPASTGYVINFDHVELDMMDGAAMQVLGDNERESTNQFAFSTLMGYMANWTCSAFFLNGTLTA